MGLAELPSGAEFDDFADLCRGIAEEADDATSWKDVLELILVVCNHPVRVFLCRACDLVTTGDVEDD
jgi:hypothetical protein